jgi:hypothetical protein
LKHIIQTMQATLACVIMVAMIFSFPLLAVAFPLQVDVSLSSWTHFLPIHRHADNALPI